MLAVVGEPGGLAGADSDACGSADCCGGKSKPLSLLSIDDDDDVVDDEDDEEEEAVADEKDRGQSGQVSWLRAAGDGSSGWTRVATCCLAAPIDWRLPLGLR